MGATRMMLALSIVHSVRSGHIPPFPEILFPGFRTTMTRSLCGATEQMAANVGRYLINACPHPDYPAHTRELSVVSR